MKCKRSVKILPAATLVALSLSIFPLSAEVVETSPDSFTLRGSVEVATDAMRSYEAILDVGSWWDRSHTWSGDSRRLTLTVSPEGCFCESLPSGGIVRHATLLFADPGRMIRLSGAFGPLQEHPLVGVLTFSLSPKPAGSTIEMVYRVAGTMPGGLSEWAPLVDQVLSSQLHRLGRYLNTGSPEDSAPQETDQDRPSGPRQN